MNRFRTCVSVGLALLVAVVIEPALAHDTITVRAGYTHLMDAPGVNRVSVGNGQLVEVRTFEDTSQILFIGSAPGKTDVRVWTDDQAKPRNYNLIVTPSRPRISLSQLRAVVDKLEGLTVEPLADGELLVTGQAARLNDKALVVALAERYPEIQDQVQAPAVLDRPTINISAKVVEIRRTSVEDLGIDWAQSMNGPEAAYIGDFATNSLFRPGAQNGLNLSANAAGLTDLGSRGYFGIATRITSIINLLSQDGIARLLAEPQISVSSGSQARMVVGGQLPITAVDDQGQIQTSFKDFGVILEVSPLSDGVNGLIQTAVSVEVSNLDPSVTVNGVPGTVSRTTNTEVTLRSGESFVVSGLLSQESSDEVTRVPGVGRLPVIGGLFRSERQQNLETELVVVIRPTLVSALDPVNQRRLEEFEEQVARGKSRIRFTDMD